MGGIGIVRLSGAEARDVAERLFRPANGGRLDRHSHRVSYGHVVDPSDGRIIDEALVTFMAAPKTYTREDVVEINCHGGPAAVKAVLELVMRSGARLAQPGEFTRRAYMNGRIDLTQAEAVMDLIASRTELSLKSAVEQLKGGLGDKVDNIKDALIELSALVELSIDFVEDDVEVIPVADLRRRALDTLSSIKSLLSTYDEGRILREGLGVTIVGRPNVGKSSLLNALVGFDRAIVTEIPGTTRDTVEEVINLGGVPVRIMDTAGIRRSHDPVEQEGVRRSEAAIGSAGLVLFVLDGSSALTGEDEELVFKVKDGKCLVVVNKSDLSAAFDDSSLKALIGEGQWVRLSAKSGAGLTDLIGHVRDIALGGGREAGVGVTINLRHKEALQRAESALVRFDAGCDESLSPEFLAVELKDALNAVGEVVGGATPDDVLDKIFRDFCIGK